MHVPKIIAEIGVFIAGAISRLFGLTDDAYPATGIQPYEGKLPSKKQKPRSRW